MFIISRYNEDISWIKNYNSPFIIYNKGEDIEFDNVVKVENIGGNQIDIFRFVIDNYSNLPEKMIFIQANPFDHCRKDIFDKLIKRNVFTSLEYYGINPANGFESRDFDCGFMEINNNWYISAHNNTYHKSCKYSSFDNFMSKYFSNYRHIDYIRFSPGSQYIVTKKQIKHYPKSFWESLFNELTELNSTEAHIIERSLWMIFQCTLELKNG